METTKTERIRLGIFLLICLGVIFGFTFYLIGQKLRDNRVPYYTIFKESVQGLSKDAKVMLNGIDVGKVTSLKIDTNNISNVIVHFEVAPGTPIKTGTRVQMTSGISLTGNKYLILSGGALDEEDLPEDSFVLAGSNIFSQMTEQATTIVEKIETLITNLNNVLSEENANKISRALTNLEQTTIEAHKLVKTTKQPIADLAVASSSLKNITAEIEAAHLARAIDSTLSIIDEQVSAFDVKTLNKDLIETLNSLKLLAKRADLMVYKNQDQMSNTLNQLNEVLENLNDFSQKIKDNPSAILRGSKFDRE